MNNLEIIIPVYNEGKSIKKVYRRLAQVLDTKVKWKASFIYDFDEDITVPFLQEISDEDERVVPVKQTFGKGVVNALKYGFVKAHNGPVVVVMGDDSDDLESLPKMLEVFNSNNALVVASSRYSEGGEYHGGNFIKKVLSMMAGKILYLLGIGTKDPTNNFKIYCGKFLKENLPESTGGFEVALELTVKAALRGNRVFEVAGSWKDREEGESKFKLLEWLPHYLKWFLYFLRFKFLSVKTFKRVV